MALRSLAVLDPDFRMAVESVKSEFDSHTPNAVTLLFYCTLRALREQAILYRQGRTRAQINTKKRQLIKRGFPELAYIIDEVGPQHETVRVTNAAPGESWHQYGLAADGVPIQAGNLLWSNAKYYQLYGSLAQARKLIWGKSFGDKPHIQTGIKGNPLDHYTPEQVREMLKL